MKKWELKEKRDAKTFKGKRTPRSGGLWFAKGDVKTEQFLIDSKTTKHDRFSITKKIWEKIQNEAIINRRMPLLSVEFSDPEIELIIISKDDFESLLD